MLSLQCHVDLPVSDYERRLCWHPETAEVEMTYDMQCTYKASRCEHIFIYKGDTKYFRDIEE